MKVYILILVFISTGINLKAQVINFTANGKQITRFDNLGNAVDAHDGEIAKFGDTYYLYGTSYDCGFEWNNKTAPFCGFKTYSSKDMMNWKDEGFLFDSKNLLWQSRCDGKTYGCFRPHVVYNTKYKTYVLWINVYDNVSGYRVFTAKNPIGPFMEVAEPKIAINHNMPAAGLNNGDHDLFIDDDGKGYLAFTNWRATGTIAIEALTDDYLSGTGKYIDSITPGKTEAPALFKRKGIYYLTYSDPNCGYCSGTGTSYKTAKSPLGPWSEGKKISDNSCGGQPSFVSTMKINSETIYLYGSDLWNNAAKNEALANFYWAPLDFEADGSISPIDCLKSFVVQKKQPTSQEHFTATCGIEPKKHIAQLFTASSSGSLHRFKLTTLKSGYPDKKLNLDFYESDNGEINLKKSLKRIEITTDSVGWSAKSITVSPLINLIKGKQYAIVLSSETTTGCYGFAFTEKAENSSEYILVSTDNGRSFQASKKQSLKFDLQLK